MPPAQAPSPAPRVKRPFVHLSGSPSASLSASTGPGSMDRNREPDAREKKRLKPSSTVSASGNVPAATPERVEGGGQGGKVELKEGKKDKKKRRKDKERSSLSAGTQAPAQGETFLAKAKKMAQSAPHNTADLITDDQLPHGTTGVEALTGSQQTALDKLLTVRAPISPLENEKVDREREERRKKDAQQIKELGRQLQKQKQEAEKKEAELKLRVEELEAEIKRRAEEAEGYTKAQEKWNKTEGELREAVSCQVCFETLKDPHILACGHVACKDCLVGWFRTSGAYVHPPAPEIIAETNLSYWTKQCHVCRSHITRRPARLYHIKDILRPLGLATADHIPTDSQVQRETNETDDPWHHLFPPAKENEGYKFIDEDGLTRCPICYGELDSPTCMTCDIEFSDDDFGTDDDEEDWASEEERMLGEEEVEDDDEGGVIEILANGEGRRRDGEDDAASLDGSREEHTPGEARDPTRRTGFVPDHADRADRRSARDRAAARHMDQTMAMVDRIIRQDEENSDFSGDSEEDESVEEDSDHAAGAGGLIDDEASEDGEEDASGAGSGTTGAGWGAMLRRANRRGREMDERRRNRRRRGRRDTEDEDEEEDEPDSEDAAFIDDGPIELASGTEDDDEEMDEDEAERLPVLRSRRTQRRNTASAEEPNDSPSPETLRARRVAHLDTSAGARGSGRTSRATRRAEESDDEEESRGSRRASANPQRRRRAIVDPDSD